MYKSSETMDVCSINGGAPLAGEVPNELHMALLRTSVWSVCVSTVLEISLAALVSCVRKGRWNKVPAKARHRTRMAGACRRGALHWACHCSK